MIFFKLVWFKAQPSSSKLSLKIINEKVKVYNHDDSKLNQRTNASFFNLNVQRDLLSSSDIGLILQKFYSFALIILLMFNFFILLADVTGLLNFAKIQVFYINFFDSNFILDYVWHDRVYLCVSSLLIFLCLFIIRLTEYNFKLIRGVGPSEFYFFILNSLFFFLVSIKSNNLLFFCWVLLGLVL
jgi:hypothetical protein